MLNCSSKLLIAWNHPQNADHWWFFACYNFSFILSWFCKLSQTEICNLESRFVLITETICFDDDKYRDKIKNEYKILDKNMINELNVKCMDNVNINLQQNELITKSDN